jgi:hypothetical protein
VLVIDLEQRTMQLVTRSVIDPRRSLTIGSPVIRIGLFSETAGGIHHLRLERWLPSQTPVEKTIDEKVVHLF